ncbi:MAG: hypothetical protein ACRD3W_14340 [Terriglobales bacterium]
MADPLDELQVYAVTRNGNVLMSTPIRDKRTQQELKEKLAKIDTKYGAYSNAWLTNDAAVS